MSIPTSVLAKMAMIGLSAEQAEAVSEMLCAVEAATEEATAKGYEATIEATREKGRERWRKWKDSHVANVSKRLPTAANASQQLTGEDARVEDKTSNSEIEPQFKEEKKARRAARLPSDWVLPLEWRQDAIAAGLHESRINGAALDMRDWSLSSPNGAKLDWRAAWRTWCRRAVKEMPRAGPAPPKPKTAADYLLADTMEMLHEHNGYDGSKAGRGPDVGEFSGVTVPGAARRVGVFDGGR